MRIAIDIKLSCLTRTGISAFTRNLLADIAEQENGCNEYFLLGPSRCEYPKPSLPRMHFVSVPTPPDIKVIRRFLYDQFILLREINRLRPAVFFSPYFDVPYLLKSKSVSTVHDLSLLKYGKMYKSTYHLYYEALLRRAISLSSAIVTVSETSKKEICATFDVSPDRVIVLYNKLRQGFITSSSSWDNARIRQLLQKYHIPSEYILYSGGFDERKNINRLIDAYAKMRDIDKNVPPLVMIGEFQRMEQRVRSQADILGVSEGIVLTGYVEEQDLSALYSRSTFVVYPSLYEGFGFPILEAMSMGRAVCCSDIEVFREITGGRAIFFNAENKDDIAEKMLELLHDEPLRAQNESAGLARAKFFNGVNNGKRFLEMIAGL